MPLLDTIRQSIWCLQISCALLLHHLFATGHPNSKPAALLFVKKK
jgi:hypothetical protein